MLRSYLAEFIGTFMLVFFGCGAVAVSQTNPGVFDGFAIAGAFGLAVIAAVYALGPISGAHINPAVTIAFAASGLFSWSKVPGYALAQTLGALLASWYLKLLFPTVASLGETLPNDSLQQTFGLEVILTLTLMLVIFLTTQNNPEAANFAGLVIGLTVWFEAAVFGPIEGCSMNPARSIGPGLVSGHTEGLWIYIIAPILGALIAVAVWRMLTAEEAD